MVKEENEETKCLIQVTEYLDKDLFGDQEDMSSTSKLERRPSLLRPEDVDKLYRHFLRLDSDGNGVIDQHELLQIPTISANPLAIRLLQLFDTDRSGDLNFGEFVAGLSIFSARSDPKRKLKFAFDIYDLDGDGYISNGELWGVLRMMTGDHLKKDQLQQIVDKTIRDADIDGDGKLSFEEFCSVIQANNNDFVQKWSIEDL